MQQAKERLDKLISRPERLASRLRRWCFGWTGRTLFVHLVSLSVVEEVTEVKMCMRWFYS
jgi:hypothetical protein